LLTGETDERLRNSEDRPRGGEGLEELADKHVQTRPTVGLLDG